MIGSKMKLAALALWIAATAPMPAAAQGIPLTQSEQRLLWSRAMQADSARELIAMAPPSWGPMPWTFIGPMRFENPAREETVKLRIVAIHDTCENKVAWLNVDYQVLAAPGNTVRRTATRRINKGLCS